MNTTEIHLASLEINKIEALLEMMFLAAYADGEVSEIERSAFRSQILVGTEGQLQVAIVEMILRQVETAFEQESREDRFAAIRQRVPEERMRRALLEVAARIIRVDGKLHVDEVAFLGRAAEALELDPAIARELLDKPLG
jgi:uncharacterized tellurite resistance protein B-like protein